MTQYAFLDRLPPRPDGRERSPDNPGPHPESRLVDRAELKRYVAGRLCRDEDMVAVEEPLVVRIEGRVETVIDRTPGDDVNLITGHLFSLGLIRSAEDILGIDADGEDGQAFVTLRQRLKRRSAAMLPARLTIRPKQIFLLRELFEQRQRLYHSTGATHAAGLFRADGTLLAYGEDVSRHCAFDKALGRALNDDRLSMADIAMLTSRLASELAAKAATAGIPVLCGFSAATSAGMRFARQSGLTLIGRIRDDSFNIYAGSERIAS